MPQVPAPSPGTGITGQLDIQKRERGLSLGQAPFLTHDCRSYLSGNSASFFAAVSLVGKLGFRVFQMILFERFLRVEVLLVCAR